MPSRRLCFTFDIANVNGRNPQTERRFCEVQDQLMPSDMTCPAEPLDIQWAPVIVMVHLRTGIAALLTRLFRYLAAFFVGAGVAARGVFALGFVRHGRIATTPRPVFAHALAMAGIAIGILWTIPLAAAVSACEWFCHDAARCSLSAATIPHSDAGAVMPLAASASVMTM